MISEFCVEYTAAGSYTFNVPPNCTGYVLITAIGAGGGGGRGWNGCGGGGGAGESVQGLHYKVTPGGTLAVTVGAGGLGSTGTGTQALLPNHSTIGGTVVSGDAEQTRKGAFGTGDGGGYTYVGGIRVLGGAGGLSSDSTPHGGTGGGVAAYNHLAPLGNQGTNLSPTTGQDSQSGYPDQKDASRFFAGAGGAGGSKASPTGLDGGDSARNAFSAAATGGIASGAANGSGAGGTSFYGSGANGITAPSVGGTATAAGSGGSGGGATTGTFTNGGNGADGYVLLTWFEVT